MADIVLAIAEGTFAVFPRLAPVHRAEAEQGRNTGQQRLQFGYCRIAENGALLQCVFVRGVVIHTRWHGRRQRLQ